MYKGGNPSDGSMRKFFGRIQCQKCDLCLHVYNMMGDPYKRQGVQSNANRWYVAQPSPRQQQVPLIGYNKGHP